jgi:TonB family protein
MEKDKKKPLFIHQPEYPGGPKALTKFLYEHLRYPQTALEAEVEGIVLVDYDIDYQGNVTATRILQGIGYGCDEEACRVVRLLKFDVPKNRGLRVIFHKKARIQFKKPVQQPAAPTQTQQMQVSYTVVNAPPVVEKPKEKPETTYSYTVQI